MSVYDRVLKEGPIDNDLLTLEEREEVESDDRLIVHWDDVRLDSDGFALLTVQLKEHPLSLP